MTDDTPAGEPGGPAPEMPSGGYETPAPQFETPTPEQDPNATGRGTRAALIIFAAAVALHVVLLIGVKLSGDSDNVWLFLPEGLLVIVVGLVAAIVVSLRLPTQSRAPFWLAGVTCMVASFIVWGFACAVAISQ